MRPGVFLLVLAIAGAPSDRTLKNTDGVLVEVPTKGKAGSDFFNRDNTISVPGREFVYSYTITKNGKRLFCRTDAAGNSKTRDWTLVDSASDPLTIRYVGFRVLEGYGGLDDLFPDFAQTVVQQKYWASDMSLLFDGTTGLVENSGNVWTHPFRGKYFSATQLSPFPFAKFPLKKNQSWRWTLDGIDDRWADDRIVPYTGKLTGTYTYRVAGTETIATPLGKLECAAIDATAKTRLGDATLRSHFNSDYGFVRLDYRNLDGSEIVFELTKVIPPVPARTPAR